MRGEPEDELGVCDVDDSTLHTKGKTCRNWRNPFLWTLKERRALIFWSLLSMVAWLVMGVLLYGRN